MPDREESTNQIFWGSGLMWMLLGILVIVLILAGLAFMSPISQPARQPNTASTQTSGPPEGGLGQTPQPDQLFLNPEEIGHTDGIIFWSTMLLLILVIGTLRETFLRRKEQ